MGTKKKSSRHDAILPPSHGGGSVGQTATDRRLDEPRAQGNAIPEGPSREVCELLDGESIRTYFGFDAITEERIMFIPFSTTRCPTQALLICRHDGLIVEKLYALPDEVADVLYWTHLPSRDHLDN